MNTLPTTTPNQVVAPAGETPAIQQPASQDQTVTYNEGNGVPDTIVMTGPLSEIYTRALGVYFAKKPLDGSVLASESQALDTVRNAALSQSADVGLREIANAVTLQTPSEVVSNVDATVYAVDASQIDRPEVIDAMDRLRTRAHASGMEYVMAVVVEPMKEVRSCFMGANAGFEVAPIENPTHNGNDNGFTRATESYCASLGFPMVYSMEGLANWIIERQANKGNKAAMEHLTRVMESLRIERPCIATEGFIDFAKKMFGIPKAEKLIKRAPVQETSQQKLEAAKTAVGKAIDGLKEEEVTLTIEAGEAKTYKDVMKLIDWFNGVLAKAESIVGTNVTNQEKLIRAYIPFIMENADPVVENKKLMTIVKSIQQQQPGLYNGMKYNKDGKITSLYDPFEYTKVRVMAVEIESVIQKDAFGEDEDKWMTDFYPYAWSYGQSGDENKKTVQIKMSPSEHRTFLEALAELVDNVAKAEDVLNNINGEDVFETIGKIIEDFPEQWDDYLYELVKSYSRNGMCWGMYTITESATRFVRHNAKA